MIVCENCGTKNQPDSKFCTDCGMKMTEAKYSAPMASTIVSGVGFGDRPTGEHLVMHCTMCGSKDFAQDKGRLDSKWGWTSFKVVMMTCQRCGHVELFNKGRSIFDFD